jgi:hypothetical protein
MITPPNVQSPNIGVDLRDDDETALTAFIPHVGHPGCGYTVISDEEITLYRLGLFPVRCKSCLELMTDRGDV